MKVCFATYPTAFQRPGGGEGVLLSLRDALRRAGSTVDLFDPWETNLEDYDVVHYFSSYGSDEFARLRPLVRRLAVTPFIWPALPPMARLARRVRAAAGRMVGPFAPVDVLFPTSSREAGMLVQNYGVRPEQVAVVPHGADERFAMTRTGAFAREYRLRRYILCPGRVDPNKNQLRVVRALRDMDVDVVILGGPAAGADAYYELCRAEASLRTQFVAPLPRSSELLVDAFVGAACVVIASEYELCSLAALEAGVAGAPIASTTGGGMPEHMSPYAIFFDPHSENELRAAVERAVARGPVTGQREHFLKRFSWDEVARMTLDAYRRS